MPFRSVLLYWIGLSLSSSSPAALIGDNFSISGPDSRAPNVAYGAISDQYLVVWQGAAIEGRFVSPLGSPRGTVFRWFDPHYSGYSLAVAFNAVDNEFLVTWQDNGLRGEWIYGQRIRGSDGALLGPNFRINTLPGSGPVLAWNPENNTYLVVYKAYPEGGVIDLWGQRISGTGALLGDSFAISDEPAQEFNPAVSWGPSNQFLVAWFSNSVIPNSAIRCVRIDATTGARLGAPFVAAFGSAPRIACDPVGGRWLVLGGSGGRHVNLNGDLLGDVFPMSEAPLTSIGDVAFVPNVGRYVLSFCSGLNLLAQESTEIGMPVPAVPLSNPAWVPRMAQDTRRNRFLTVWEAGSDNGTHIFGQVFGLALNPVTNFTVSAALNAAVLNWNNPPNAQFSGTMIRVDTTGFPESPDAGALVVDQSGVPGENGSFIHTALTNDITYYYSAWAHDKDLTYSRVSQAEVILRLLVTVIDRSDFNSGDDGWTYQAWRAGAYPLGTIARDSGAGNIVSAGSEWLDNEASNRDTCTREGGMMTKGISTVGWEKLGIQYDVMAHLDVQGDGPILGRCPLLEQSDEDKLVVYFSTQGTNGPWQVAQSLNEGIELPTPWTRQFINLAGIPSVNNNPDFALRFQWQFNSESDTGRIDNVFLTSGAVTAQPALKFRPAILERTIEVGQDLRPDVLTVWNSGEGTLEFSAGTTASWLAVTPPVASSAGPAQRLQIAYQTASLEPGEHESTVQLRSANAASAVVTIPIRVSVIPACRWEPFDYHDTEYGFLGLGGWRPSWNHTSNSIVVENHTLKITGGAGWGGATRDFVCPGSNGIIVARINIRKGRHQYTNDFWTLSITDSRWGRLAAWTGGSTSVRSGTFFPESPVMQLTGPETWDDLSVKIDTIANTSEFYFNGASIRAVSHGTMASNTVAMVIIDRWDRAAAVGDTVYFDNLSVGAADLAPPRLRFIPITNGLELSWPAISMGFNLEAAADLGPNASWTLVSDGIRLINGDRVFAATNLTESRFYRLRDR